MSYKSKHTGAQVDEAVSKVLNGDIEGSNIKEGSIPLSALATEVKDKLNNIFTVPDDFIEEQYDEPDEGGAMGKVKQVYVTDILENGYTKVNIGGILGDINITDDFINIIMKYEVFETEKKEESYSELFILIQDCTYTQQVYINKSPFITPAIFTDVANINGDIRLDFVKSVTDEETTIPEENKQLFKKNMGSFADWNAQKGEAGYIENKPSIVTPENVERKLYYQHLNTIININTEDLVTDSDSIVTDYKGNTYDGLEGLINGIKTTIAYCLANFLIPQIHLVDWYYTMPAVFYSDPRTLANEDDDYETIVNKLHNNGFTVIFGAGDPDAGGIIVKIMHVVEEGLYFYLYEY
jgi:hypothetical protein